MKITIATGPIFPVPAVRGGAVQRLWEGLARDFAKRGHEVTIFARQFPGQAKEEIVDGIRYVRRGGYEQSTSIKRDLVQCLIYALKTARQVPTGDVVVTNDFWMPAVLPWLNPAAGKVVPCLQRYPKNQAALYGKCPALVAVSQAVADAVKAQSPSVASKVVVVPNAIDDVFLRETKRARDEETKRQPSLRDGLQSNQLIKDQGTAEAEPRQVAAATNRPKDQEPQFAEADGDSAGPAEAGRGQTQGLQDYGTTVQGTGKGEQTARGRRPARILYVGRIHPEKGLGLLAKALRLLAAKDKETKRQPSLRDGLQSNQQIKDEGTKGQPSPRDGLQCNQLIQDSGTKRQTDEEPKSAAAGGDGVSPVIAGRGQTKEWECVLVGPVRESEGGGGEAFAEELKRQVEGLPVRFQKPVYTPAALVKIYDQANVFVYPSVAETGESFGIAPLEAMARGVVPVVSNLAAFREYLEPGVNGMVFDHRSKEPAASLASVLDELVTDAGKRGQLGVEARATAECFSTGAIADKYLQLFARLV